MLYRSAFSRAGRPDDGQRGFTLIEALVALAIVGILAAIAYPSYTSYIERSQRAEAQTVMMDIARRLERCYTDSYSYQNCDSATKKANEATSALYTKFETSPTASEYRIIATGGTRAKDGCAILKLESSGKRLPDDDPERDTECW
ncbi:type IV pilin protein [Halomonas piscis]|uniref:Type IV pilin protein n=1 Tax=Halomonas piscis TaxID=3031727 RepID=A0ABY9Z0P7_9GAMM|nr:type IV pilin protein [Halomonas piscis]WNK20602.1 type IV pilin protein [Halomonas piscis]